MDGWADYLHSSLTGEHALFPALRLSSSGSFLAAAILSASICLAERCASYTRSLSKAQQNLEKHDFILSSSLTFALSQHWVPFRAIRRSRAHSALWRAGLYALATLLRLCAIGPPSTPPNSLLSHCPQTLHAAFDDVPPLVSGP